jgi:hypothetical protein
MTFRITDYGMNVLKLYNEMEQLLVYNPIRLNDSVARTIKQYNGTKIILISACLMN